MSAPDLRDVLLAAFINRSVGPSAANVRDLTFAVLTHPANVSALADVLLSTPEGRDEAWARLAEQAEAYETSDGTRFWYLHIYDDVTRAAPRSPAAAARFTRAMPLFLRRPTEGDPR